MLASSKNVAVPKIRKKSIGRKPTRTVLANTATQHHPVHICNDVVGEATCAALGRDCS